MTTKLGRYIDKKTKFHENLDSLDTDTRVLFDFLKLVVDINYQQRYGGIAAQSTKGYTSDVQFNKVLADQIPSVDNGLQGYASTEVI